METSHGLPGRLVTLVLVDGAGTPLGALDPFEVATPWWQDLLPLHDRYPDIVVLRLLTAERAPGHPMGGRVTYLAETTGEPPPGLRPFEAVLEDHPLRMPWARPGGPTEDLAWARSVVEVTGTPVQHRSWNLSAIWSIPVATERDVWLKCLPPFFEHETAVLRLLADQPVPELVAADRHRQLLSALPGEDGYGATDLEHRGLIDRLVAMQARTVSRLAEFRDAGVPDCRWAPLAADLESLLDRRAPVDPALVELAGTFARRAALIDECGLPDVLVHGDAHPGNARIGVDPPIWFDWGDSCIGHPMLDLDVLAERPGGGSDEMTEHWLDAWARAVPGSDPARAWSLIRPVAALRLGVVYQRFLDNIEPSERIYHDQDVQPCLDRAARLARLSPC